jgi:hypothetical protein
MVGSVGYWSGQFSVDTERGGPAMPTIREDDEGESALKMNGRGTGAGIVLRAFFRAGSSARPTQRPQSVNKPLHGRKGQGSSANAEGL